MKRYVFVCEEVVLVGMLMVGNMLGRGIDSLVFSISAGFLLLRRFTFFLDHSLVSVSKTSGDSYRIAVLPSGKGPTSPRKIGNPRSAKSVLQSSIPICSCISAMLSTDSNSFSRMDPSGARVITRIILFCFTMSHLKLKLRTEFISFSVPTPWGNSTPCRHCTG